MSKIDFRKTIRAALDAGKMKVPELARQVGCNQMAIYNFLAGRTQMKADLLGKILTALEIKLAPADILDTDSHGFTREKKI